MHSDYIAAALIGLVSAASPAILFPWRTARQPLHFIAGSAIGLLLNCLITLVLTMGTFVALSVFLFNLRDVYPLDAQEWLTFAIFALAGAGIGEWLSSRIWKRRGGISVRLRTRLRSGTPPNNSLERSRDR